MKIVFYPPPRRFLYRAICQKKNEHMLSKKLRKLDKWKTKEGVASETLESFPFLPQSVLNEVVVFGFAWWCLNLHLRWQWPEMRKCSSSGNGGFQKCSSAHAVIPTNVHGPQKLNSCFLTLFVPQRSFPFSHRLSCSHEPFHVIGSERPGLAVVLFYVNRVVLRWGFFLNGITNPAPSAR